MRQLLETFQFPLSPHLDPADFFIFFPIVVYDFVMYIGFWLTSFCSKSSQASHNTQVGQAHTLGILVSLDGLDPLCHG